MASKMNTKTHKVFVATFTKRTAYAVPIDWDIDDAYVYYDDLFYKDEKQEDPHMCEICDDYQDGEAHHFKEEKDCLEEYFDCEEEEEFDIDKVIEFIRTKPEEAKHSQELIDFYHKVFGDKE